ncbi:MAG: leucine-rich repeat protein [Clostridia bacterium]|nr:leucine-rich repeat protein [Clostridia bacterium]
MTGLSLCLTSCQIGRINGTNVGGNTDEQVSIKNDAYENKILYYEAQIQSLNTQLDDMEQQMLLMRDDYLTQLQSLKDRLQSNNEESEATEKENEAQEPENEPTVEDVPQAPVKDKGVGVIGGVVLREYTYRLENGCAILTAYQGEDNHVSVPAAVDGYLVVGLDDRTFAECDVQSVRLPETIERIGWFTFYGCDQLVEVTLPEKLSSIGYASFDGCAPTLCLRVKSGSYAESFANSFGIRCQQDA